MLLVSFSERPEVDIAREFVSPGWRTNTGIPAVCTGQKRTLTNGDHAVCRVLAAELPLRAAEHAERWELGAATVRTPFTHDVDHALAGVRSAAVRLPASFHAVRRALRAPVVAALLCAEHDHVLGGMPRAEFGGLASDGSVRSLLAAALVDALLVRDVHGALRVARAKLPFFATGSAIRRLGLAARVAAHVLVDPHHPGQRMARAPLPLPASLPPVRGRRLAPGVGATPPPAVKVEHSIGRVPGAELTLPATFRAKRCGRAAVRVSAFP